MTLKLNHKILLLYVGVGLCILILIGTLLSRTLRTNIMTSISNNYSKQLAHIDFGLSGFFKNMEHDLETIAQNELVRSQIDGNFTNFLKADEHTFQYNIGELEQQIIDIFNRYRTTHPHVHSVYMGRENGSFVRSHKRAKPTRYDPRTRPWYVLGKKNPAKIMRTPPFRSVTTPDVSIDFVKALVDSEQNVYGVLGISITLAELMGYVSTIPLDYKGFLVLVDENGTILASRDKSLLFTSLKSFDPDLYQQIFSNQEGFLVVEKGSKKRYVFFYTSPSLRWKLAVTVPSAEIENAVWVHVSKILLALFMALLLLSVLTLVGLKRFVIGPLTKLNETTGLIKRTGNLDYQIEVQSGDEIGQLGQSFNEMMTTLNQADIALKESEKELRKHRDNLEELVEERTAELKENQERLARTEERSRMLLESAGEGIFGVGQDGLVNFINPAGLAMLGFEAEEVVGKKIHALIHHTRHDGTPYPIEECPMYHTLTQGTIGKRDDEILWRKDGTCFPVEYTSVPIRKNDSITGTVVVFSNIAERKKAEEVIKNSERRQSQIINFLPDPTWVVDNDGKVVSWNRAMENLTGIRAEDMLGKGNYEYALPFYGERRPVLIDLVREWDASYEKEYLSVKKDGDILTSQSYHHHLSDDGMYLSGSAALLYDAAGKVAGAIESLRDITANKRMEEALSKAKKAADEANRAKSDFLANMSHEIRTPMNAVIGMTHLALKTDLTSKQRDYLNKIQSSANSLLGIINDILDFSKIEAGKLDMESTDFNLEDVLDNLANLITVKAQEKEDLEVLFATSQDVPRFLVGDPLRLGQVLINLANNAIKFTESGEIVVSTELINQINGRITLKFAVSDTGIGLSRDQMVNLFKAFTQADTSTTRKYGGTGLGLTISKRLVEMMGGEIWVESQQGRGSTFSFSATFGLGKEKTEPRFKPSLDLRNMKVLVVDDNITSREILQDMLESFSFDVTPAASGKEGLTELENAPKDQPFDLVIMDWKMPGMDGIQAAERIKNLKNLSKIPAIIMVTAYGREEVMQKAARLGLDGFLIKPVSPSVLFDTIMQAFGKEVSETSRVATLKEEGDSLQKIKGARVLLVEDNEINRQVAKEILEAAGLVVSLANNGHEAVNAVKQNDHDAVLMDIQMPVMDGYTATRKIREWEGGSGKAEKELKAQSSKPKVKEREDRGQNINSEFKRVPIIAMTAHAMAGDEAKSLEAGMNDHVTKPIDPNQLFAMLQRWIRPAELRAAARRPEVKLVPSDSAPPDSGEEHFPESLPGFDLAEGLNRLQGNERLYRKLLLDFGTTYKGAAAEIRKALDLKDMEQAHSLVHNLKGLAGNLAAIDLQAAAIEMEKLVKPADRRDQPSAEDLNLTFTKLEAALNDTLQSLQTFGAASILPNPEPSEDILTALPLELTKDAAKCILEAAEMGDVNRLKTIAEGLVAETKVFAPFSKKIIHLAQEFDFDGITKLVGETTDSK